MDGMETPIDASAGRIKILLVDDESLMRLCVSKLLQAEGYSVVTAGNGLKALELLEAEDFDLLITDNHMPQLSGLELVRKLRVIGRDIPIIMASSHCQELLEAENSWLNVSAMIEKPFSFPTLLAAIDHALRHSQGARCSMA